jgi:hypothetical protein
MTDTITPETDAAIAAVRAAVDDAVAEYDARGDVPRLLARLADAAEGASADALVAAAEPYRRLLEVSGPLYERVVALRPDDARALVRLAEAYWLTGRGPEVVGELAGRAVAADPTYAAGWHLWALTESDPRQRMRRWQQVTTRFPDDRMARAALADAAAAVAGAEYDTEALALAVATLEHLVAIAERPEERAEAERALSTLKAWKL